MLECYTSHNLVSTHIIGYVILDVPDGVVNGVVPCEKLITQSHVVIAILSDIDEWELIRVGATDIVELRDSSQELVRQIVSQTAVQIQ